MQIQTRLYNKNDIPITQQVPEDFPKAAKLFIYNKKISVTIRSLLYDDFFF